MNWQIIVGIIFIISSIGCLSDGFANFILALLIGAAFLFYGIRKRKPRKKFDAPTARTLTEEDFHAVGVYYYKENISKLACKNADWGLTTSQIISSGKTDRKIYKNNYINKPVKLVFEPDNKNDPNAIAVVIAGEKVGYISREDNIHVREIIQKREVKSISGFIGGGDYKIITDSKDIIKASLDFTVNIRIKYI